MRSAVAAIIAGLAGWILIGTALDVALRLWLPGYARAEPTLVFTLGMKIARLSIGALTSLGAGALVRAIAPGSRPAPWIVGLLMVALFVPAHVHLWNRFPIWYHLTFLLTLAPLLALGAWLISRGTGKFSAEERV